MLIRETAELLNTVEERLHQLTIASNHPSTHHLYNRLLPQIPVACLKIPNKIYLVADRIKCLKKVLKMRIPGLIETVNEIVEEGGDKISCDASKAEERLELKSRR